MPAQASEILISFCNVPTGAPTLGLLDLVTADIRILAVPHDLSRQGGATGIALTDDYVFVAAPRAAGTREAGQPDGPSSLFTFDRRTFAPLAHHHCTSVYDAHSLVVDGGDLLVVSTGTDAVVRLRLDGPSVQSEEPFWRPDPQGQVKDLHHLNAICRRDDRILISGFGRRAGPMWSSATGGFIHDLTANEPVATGIGHPHSIAIIDQGLAYCESAAGEVAILGTSRRQQLGGYTRGLCTVDDTLFVATSRGRHASRSTGALTTLADPGTLTGGCSVSRLRGSDLAVEWTTILDPYGWEIYETVPVSGTALWPVAPELEWRDELIAGLKHRRDDRDALVSSLHIEVARRDQDLAWLHGEVAARDRLVEQLRADLADRDRLVSELRNSMQPALPTDDAS